MRLISGDCIEAMRELSEASVDAVVTDPPYGINFMGKAWDGKAIAEAAKNAGGDHHKSRERSASMHAGSYDLSPSANQAFQLWCQQWTEECLRVLKPGGHLLSFSGSRTYHRLACAVEDAGFEVRDQMMWLYGSGFPKSLDVLKAIDKAAGAEREVVGTSENGIAGGTKEHAGNPDAYNFAGEFAITVPATEQAVQWNGWGTALKPAHEPIVVARKPLAGTVAENVLAHGTGALNIDGCRIKGGPSVGGSSGGSKGTRDRVGGFGHDSHEVDRTLAAGRWPANVILDEEAGRLLDEQSGERPSGIAVQRNGGGGKIWGAENKRGNVPDAGYSDTGGASRFFYCAKASKGERNAGLDDDRNVHPTVKPISLMRYLVRLVTPPQGTVLDPFLGSGTTGCAAVLEGFDFIGIEREPEYLAIAQARIEWWEKHRGDGATEEILKAAGVRDEVENSGQLGLLDEAA